MHSPRNDSADDAFFRALLVAGVDVNKLEGELEVVPEPREHAMAIEQLKKLIAGGVDETSLGDSRIVRRDAGLLFFGPPMRSDRDRILRRIRSGAYAAQLGSAAEPTALIVRSSTAFLEATERQLIEWAQDLQQALRATRLGVLVVVEETSVAPMPIEEDGYSCGATCDADDGMLRAVLRVANDRAPARLSIAELDVLAGPDMVW